MPEKTKAERTVRAADPFALLIAALYGVSHAVWGFEVPDEVLATLMAAAAAIRVWVERVALREG